MKKYKMKSSDGSQYYTITEEEGRLTCNCPGFVNRGKCYHEKKVNDHLLAKISK